MKRKSAMGNGNMCGPCGCHPLLAWIVLVLGVLYLISDFSGWNFRLNWWTAAFLMTGIWMVGMSKMKY